MIDLQEIDDAIAQLEHGKTTYSALERLSVLYAVRDRLRAGDDPVQIEKQYSGYSFAAEPMSEFLEVATRAPVEGVLKVLDEHLTAVQAIYPKEYEAVMRMLRKL